MQPGLACIVVGHMRLGGERVGRRDEHDPALAAGSHHGPSRRLPDQEAGGEVDGEGLFPLLLRELQE